MTSRKSKRRWFRPTPGWPVLASLATSGLLLLSDQYQWFAFNEFREITTLYIITNLGVMVFVILLWFIAALLFRWRFQFTIRSLLLLVIAVALPFGWIASRIRQAERQRQGIALVERLGGDAHLSRLSEVLGDLQQMFPDVFYKEVCFVEFKSKNSSLSDTDVSEVVRLLPHIEMLFLRTPAITDAGLEPVARLKELTWLSLSSTRITDAGINRLDTLQHLHTLDLESTSISDVGLERLARHELWSLKLSGTKVTDAGMEHIDGHNLVLLTLNETRVSDVGLAHVSQQKRLRVLLLSGTLITDVGLGQISGLKDLVMLDLSRTRVTDNGIKQLKNVMTLSYVNLSNTQITDRGLEYLKGMHVEGLNLANTHITDSGLELLAAAKPDGLGAPNKLSLVGTATTKAGVKKLQQAWPDCQIER